MTVSLFVQITVKDFDAWKANFDGAAQLMKDNGVIANHVHRNLDDPHSIMILQQIAEDNFQSYMAMLEGSQERRDAEGILSWEQWVGQVV